MLSEWCLVLKPGVHCQLVLSSTVYEKKDRQTVGFGYKTWSLLRIFKT